MYLHVFSQSAGRNCCNRSLKIELKQWNCRCISTRLRVSFSSHTSKNVRGHCKSFGSVCQGNLEGLISISEILCACNLFKSQLK